MWREDPFAVVSFRFPELWLKWVSKRRITHPRSVSIPGSTVKADNPRLDDSRALSPQQAYSGNSCLPGPGTPRWIHWLLPDQEETCQWMLRQSRMMDVCAGPGTVLDGHGGTCLWSQYPGARGSSTVCGPGQSELCSETLWLCLFCFCS